MPIKEQKPRCHWVPLVFSYESFVKDQAEWFLQENLRNTLRNRLVEFLKKLRNETGWKLNLFLINHTECNRIEPCMNIAVNQTVTCSTSSRHVTPRHGTIRRKAQAPEWGGGWRGRYPSFSSSYGDCHGEAVALSEAIRHVQADFPVSAQQGKWIVPSAQIDLWITSQRDPCFAMGNSVEKLNFASHQTLACARSLLLYHCKFLHPQDHSGAVHSRFLMSGVRGTSGPTEYEPRCARDIPDPLSTNQSGVREGHPGSTDPLSTNRADGHTYSQRIRFI